MSIQWQRDSSLVFESREQAFSEAEPLSNEHTYRVMQIDGHPPAYAIERKLPERVQKYTDDEDEDTSFEERAETESHQTDGMRRDRQAQRDRDERTDDVPSDEEPYSGHDRDEWE